MGFQFAHIETYSRSGGRNGKLNIADIISEARRSPEASLHVSNPKKPVHVFGSDFNELISCHDTMISSTFETLANGRKRAIRKDTCSLFTCVLSHPATPDECRSDPDVKASVEEWARDSVKWLRHDLEARGGTLETVIMHVDESHIHLHAYGLHSSGYADRLHPGKAAKKRAAEEATLGGQSKKAANAVGDRAYVSAMRVWQDSYSTSVGLSHGLTRLGPARRRLSRAEWMTEKAAAQSVQKAKVLAAAAKDAARAADDIREQRVLEAQKITAHAKHEANAIVHAAQNEHDRVIARARAEVLKVRSIGIWLRNFWDTLRMSSIREALWKEVQPLIDNERQRTVEIQKRLRNETNRRAVAEVRFSNSAQEMQALIHERNKLRRQRDRLLNHDGENFKPNGPKL